MRNAAEELADFQIITTKLLTDDSSNSPQPKNEKIKISTQLLRQLAISLAMS